MPSFAIILAGLSLLIWIVLAFFRGAFWQLSGFDDDVAQHDSRPSRPRVVAVVPARNEAETITRVVESLVAQDYPGEFQIILVDDHSEDLTVVLAQRAAQAGNGGDRVTILQAAPLQPGWTGKLWALQQGMSKAASFAPDYLWFADADIVHAPDTLGRLVARAESQRLDLLSLMVLSQAKTLSERMLIPPFLYFFLLLYPPKWIADPKSRTAGAAGGCILITERDAGELRGNIGNSRRTD